MFHLIDRWLSKNKNDSESRLSKDEVLNIAREAASEYPNCEDLNIVTLEQQSGASIWIVSSATVGRTLQVSVDDTNGDVLEIKQIGVR